MDGGHLIFTLHFNFCRLQYELGLVVSSIADGVFTNKVCE